MIGRDNIENILGFNSADNLYDSSNVTSNANGSMIERQEYMQGLLAGIDAGQVILQGVAPALTSSTTAIVLANLGGYGDDFFNTYFYVQILKNANSAAAAPESEVRRITNYVSTTGAFTTAAFSQVVEADDICLILHESQVATIAPTADLATDGRVAYVVGLKADTVAGNSLVSLVKKTIAALLFPTLNLATDLTTAQVVGMKADTVAGTSIVSIIKQVLARLVKPGANAADDATPADVIGIKADTVVGTSLVALVRQAIAATLFPTLNLATDLTMAQVIGQKADTVAGTSIVALIRQLIAKFVKPGGDVVDDATIADVIGIKADTVAGTSVIARLKQILAATLFPTLNLATDATFAQVIGQKADTIAGTSLVSIARIQKAETVLIKAETDKIAATILKIDAEIIKTAAIKAKTDYLPTKITKTQTFVNTAAATIDLFTVTGTVDIELCAVVKTNVESAAGCNIKVDCGALAIIADSDCTTLEAADIWFANTPTTSVVALNPPAASFALSPVKKFRITNGQDITMTIEAAKQVDSGVIDYYVKWEAVSADGAVVAAA